MFREMRLIEDYEHHYRAGNGFEARARVRLFEPGPSDQAVGAVAIVSEPAAADYDGPSVTNNIEQLAGEVVMRFALPSTQAVFIEHYPPEAEPFGDAETFDLVSFDREDPEPVLRSGRWILELGAPDWQRIERQDVEDLIGRRLDP